MAMIGSHKTMSSGPPTVIRQTTEKTTPPTTSKNGLLATANPLPGMIALRPMTSQGGAVREPVKSPATRAASGGRTRQMNAHPITGGLRVRQRPERAP